MKMTILSIKKSKIITLQIFSSENKAKESISTANSLKKWKISKKIKNRDYLSIFSNVWLMEIVIFVLKKKIWKGK